MTAFAEAYHQAGRHEDELATLERGRRRYPNNRTIVVRELGALAALRRGAQAIALVDTVLRGETDSLGAQVEGTIRAAFEFEAHGDAETARRIVRQSLAWYTAHPLRDEPPRRSLARGHAFLALGQADSAEAHLARAVRDTSLLNAAGLLAVTRLRRTGDRATALRAADSLGALQREWMFGSHLYNQAAIVAHVGELERATQLLRRAHQAGAGKAAWHYAPILEPLRRYPPFVALITPER